MAYNKEQAQQYYLKNKEKILQRNAEWQANNKDKMKEYSKKYKSSDNPAYLKYCEDNYQKWLLANAYRASKERGIPCNLELDDIKIPEKCPYLECTLTFIRGAGRNVDTNASIDKVVPSLGYVKGNIEIISRQANRMKNNATPEQIIMFAENILKRKDIFVSKYHD